MPEQETAPTATVTDDPAPGEARLPVVKAIAVPGLPAGIRWWEACGGWSARYSLGTF
ncbi:hypothetical protein SCMU_30720 [Sinomonas cyclohexanicum]|uniref:Uncharacterized protein n=1 Tax=Sinomonas cyclohexanicum TaxID=322009 RepID=A0ABM7PYT3_SINCY|nr:hypothetical protein [Corynebacterium cyclohexanicum]BCT77230.1 hypothetical protein SCMU_30720 [Corynebacterium cyclohexanicum]